MTNSPTKLIGRVLFWLLVVVIAVYTMFPFYWVFRSSVSTDKELSQSPPAYWPQNFTFENYRLVFGSDQFITALRNSVIVAGSVTIISLIIGTMASYALGRFRFRGRTPILYLVLAMTMFPQIAILGALFTMINNIQMSTVLAIGIVIAALVGFVLAARLVLMLIAYFNRREPLPPREFILDIVGLAIVVYLALFALPQALADSGTQALYNRLGALVLTYMIFTLPFTVWVLTSFFRQMPRELEEAAYVDGASPFQTFYQVMLPLVGPGLVTTGLMAFIAAWNEYLYALSFTQTQQHRTVTYAITAFAPSTAGGFEIPWGQIMAATVVVTVPLILLTLIFQRFILGGLTAGAVKG